MRIGVSGSRILSREQERVVKRILTGILSCYGPEDELHHGGAKGVDLIASQVGNRFGLKVIAHPAKTPKWDGVSGYKARNMEIVNSSDKVYAIHSPTSSTGGTIWTFNYAEGLGKQVEWIELPL